jgi:hypothetical protein
MRLTSRLQIPGQNKRERWHWAKQRREVSGWEVQFRALTSPASLAPYTAKKLHVTITSYRRQRFHDEANLIGGCKGLVDGLVRAGVLVDDSTTWATFTYRQETLAKSPLGYLQPCTVVEIEEA